MQNKYPSRRLQIINQSKLIQCLTVFIKEVDGFYWNNILFTGNCFAIFWAFLFLCVLLFLRASVSFCDMNVHFHGVPVDFHEFIFSKLYYYQ